MNHGSSPSVLPDISKMPDETLLSRDQLAALTGFTNQTFLKWAKAGRGPRVIYVEGRPRTTVGDFKAWIAASARAA